MADTRTEPDTDPTAVAPSDPAQACPVPVLGALGGECPVDHAGSGDSPSQDSAARMFSTSVVISGIRCVLAYVVFPWILPLFGLTDWLGPWIGVAISVVAIGFNLASIRRFWRADHPWKWPISCINVSVIGLLSVLLVWTSVRSWADPSARRAQRANRRRPRGRRGAARPPTARARPGSARARRHPPPRTRSP
ncbi:MAG: hypothetical protein R2716_11955 [Microthrixaceae bacterium]